MPNYVHIPVGPTSARRRTSSPRAASNMRRSLPTSSAASGSRFTMALLRMLRARLAYFRVLSVSSRLASAGEMHAAVQGRVHHARRVITHTRV